MNRARRRALDVSRQVYAGGVYASKGQNQTTNASDNVFSDGTSTEMATLPAASRAAIRRR